MVKTVGDMLTIMRNVTGRNDAADPMFTDVKMIQWLSDFYQLIMGQEARFFDMNNWYEFVLPAGQDEWPIDMNVGGAVNRTVLRAPAYVDGFVCGFTVDPANFYYLWPETQEYEESRPTYILFYDHKLIFRAPPDKNYDVKIASIDLLEPLTSTAKPGDVGIQIQEDYWWRYVAYGASIDLLQDYNEMDRVAEVMPAFLRYKNIVYSRTMTQLDIQRSNPTF